MKLEDLRLDPLTFTQTFTAPGEKRPMLHGYHVQTEGVSLRLNAAAVERAIEAELAALDQDEKLRRWRSGQMLRFLIESKATFAGVNSYEAMRGAELMVSAAADPDLRRKLTRLRSFWGDKALRELFEETRSALLSQHPLLSQARVHAVATSLSDQRFQKIFQDALSSVSDPSAFRRYLKSALIHSLANRIKASFSKFGGGDERRVIAHARLPIQFKGAPDLEITICEAGAFGDGTTRSFIANFAEFQKDWLDGFDRCPNAEEDAAYQRFLANRRHHSAWRDLDPHDPNSLATIASTLQLDDSKPVPSSILKVLFGTETIGAERFSLYDLSEAVQQVETEFVSQSQRRPTVWELASAAVRRAKEEPDGHLGKLLTSYENLEDAVLEEALSPEGRLTDQVVRLSGTLCYDGCRACVHQPSDMMSDNMVESSTSRTILHRFLCVPS